MACLDWRREASRLSHISQLFSTSFWHLSSSSELVDDRIAGSLAYVDDLVDLSRCACARPTSAVSYTSSILEQRQVSWSGGREVVASEILLSVGSTASIVWKASSCKELEFSYSEYVSCPAVGGARLRSVCSRSELAMMASHANWVSMSRSFSDSSSGAVAPFTGHGMLLSVLLAPRCRRGIRRGAFLVAGRLALVYEHTMRLSKHRRHPCSSPVHLICQC